MLIVVCAANVNQTTDQISHNGVPTPQYAILTHYHRTIVLATATFDATVNAEPKYYENGYYDKINHRYLNYVLAAEIMEKATHSFCR